MIAMPSSSTAMMNVSLNWPSAIIGRMTGAPSSRLKPAPTTEPDPAPTTEAEPAPPADEELAPTTDEGPVTSARGSDEPWGPALAGSGVHRLGNVPAYVVGSGKVVA